MKEAGNEMKSAAVPRNITFLRPIIDCETQCSGKVSVFRRFNEIREELIEASEHEDIEFTINSSARFGNKMRKYYLMLSEIDAVNKSLQKKGRTLADCLIDLDCPIEAVELKRNNASTHLFGCN